MEKTRAVIKLSKKTFEELTLELLKSLLREIPISVLLTAIASCILGWCILPNIAITFLGKNLPFIGMEIYGWTDTFFRLIIFISYFSACLHRAEKETIFVFTILGRRIPVYEKEGLIGTIIPIIIGGETTDIREETIGSEEKNGVKIDKIIKVQSRDKQEVSIAYGGQIKIFDPILWYNTKEPLVAIINKLEGQLRIIVGLFNPDDIEQFKGILVDILSGISYVIWRNKNGSLLRDEGGNIVNMKKNLSATEKRRIRKDGSPTAIKCLNNLLRRKDSEVIDCFKEIIPSFSFKPEDLKSEAAAVGAIVRSLTIKEITPPESVKAAGAEKEKERLQAQAREVEVLAHRSLALTMMGYDSETINISNIMSRFNKEQKQWYNENLTAVRALEKDNSTKEFVVHHIGGNNDGETKLGDSIIAAFQSKGDEK